MHRKITIRRFLPADAAAVSALIADTLRITNAKDYPEEFIAANIASHSAAVIAERARHAHMFVACDGQRIVGCGAIDGYFGSTTESILLTVFVLPACQGKGIGRAIVERLERDEFFLRAKRVEIPASVSAVGFYQKMGYTYKNGITSPDAEGCVRLEKYR